MVNSFKDENNMVDLANRAQVLKLLAECELQKNN